MFTLLQHSQTIPDNHLVLKAIFNKFKIVKLKNIFKKAWLPFYAVPLLILGPITAYFDAHAYRMFQKLEEPGKVYTTIVGEYMTLFHGLVFSGLFGMSLIVFYYRNFREALAFLVFSLAVVWSGFWDLIYYRFSFTPTMPETLTHLQGTPVGTAASIFNGGLVTPEMVALNSVLFLGLGLPLAGYIRYGDQLDILDKMPNW